MTRTSKLLKFRDVVQSLFTLMVFVSRPIFSTIINRVMVKMLIFHVKLFKRERKKSYVNIHVNYKV